MNDSLRNFFIDNIPSVIFILISLVVKTSKSEGFEPTIHTRCLNGIMNITISTESPFRGAIYTEGRRSNCSVTGVGFKHTSIGVPFAAMERCGIQYNADEEQYYVLLIVRQHPMIILQQDRVYNVSCPKTSVNDDSNESVPNIQMGLFSTDGRKMHQAVFGNNYTIKVWSNGVDQDFVVTTCQGFSSYNYSLELTNPNGCSRDTELLSNFKYDRKDKVAVAQLYSMFKFPLQQMVHLQCAAIFCQGVCVKPDCERRRDDPISNGKEIKDVELKRNSERLIQEKYTSTTVRVQELGNFTDVYYEISCAYHYSLLSALCILFAGLFAVTLLVNVAFCALTGYCCCGSIDPTKTEQVEYVVADAKSIDALNCTVARPYSSAIYGRANSVKSHVFIGGSSYSPHSNSSTDSQGPVLVKRVQNDASLLSAPPKSLLKFDDDALTEIE